MEEFVKAKNDKTLMNSLNIDDLLASVEKEQNKWLDKKTLSLIAKENFKTIKILDVGDEKMQKWCQHLLEFRKIMKFMSLSAVFPPK